MSSRSPAPPGGGLLPFPGSPSSSWAAYKARLSRILTPVIIAFFLFGLINNVLYVVILTAAQDLVGSSVPKAQVLLADVLPSLITKMIAPYFIHRIPYGARVVIFSVVSILGMLLIGLSSSDESAVWFKMGGIILASISSGGGELSFLGLVHYYGQSSLASWGSGTGFAGIFGAVFYNALTSWIGLDVKTSILISAILPFLMLASFFLILPREPLRKGAKTAHEYQQVPGQDVERQDEADDESDAFSANERDTGSVNATEGLLSNGRDSPALAKGNAAGGFGQISRFIIRQGGEKLGLMKPLLFPFMGPLFLVYLAEYLISQGVGPTLLFPADGHPIHRLRDFYPTYVMLYQVGVFISRSSIFWVRLPYLYPMALLQVVNLVLVILQSLYFYIPSVWIMFIIIFWEGLLGGAVYVNTFAQIAATSEDSKREFNLSLASVADSAGICMAAFLGLRLEPALCGYQVQHGRDWCRKINVG